MKVRDSQFFLQNNQMEFTFLWYSEPTPWNCIKQSDKLFELYIRVLLQGDQMNVGYHSSSRVIDFEEFSEVPWFC